MFIRLAHWLEHMPFWLQAMIVLIVGVVGPMVDAGNDPRIAFLLIIAGATSATLTVGMSMTMHAAYPCRECNVRRQADLTEQAEKYRLALRLWHVGCGTVKSTTVTILSFSIGPLLGIWLPDIATVDTGVVLLLIHIISATMVNRIHWRFAHYCPECRQEIKMLLSNFMETIESKGTENGYQ